MPTSPPLPDGWWTAARTRAEAAAPVDAAPRWATFVEQVVHAHGGVTVEVGDDGVAAFGTALAPFADVAWSLAPGSVTEASDRVDVRLLRAEFGLHLCTRLGGLAARTLVETMNRARVAGRLTGDTGRERFADFVRDLSTRDGLVGLITGYPVLARLMAVASLAALDAHVELRTRFDADRAAVAAEFGGDVDPGLLISFGPAVGDLHAGGRSVRLLTFEGGLRVVYRPRPLSVHVHFAELVAWLDDACGAIGLRSARALPRDGYGWVEFIDAVPGRDRADVHLFYRRLGALSALVYAVDGTDMHLENLIAAGDTPVLIDVETLFHPTLERPTATGDDPAATALSASVLRTAMLPQQWLGEHGALDVSGVGGDDGVAFPFDVATFTDPTDTMRLRRGPAVFRARQNRPRSDAGTVDPGDYEGSLLSGFRLAYDAIAARRHDLLAADGLLARFDHDECRVIFRPTELYARLLEESTHPDVMRSGSDRDAVFDLLVPESLGEASLEQLVPAERLDLWSGDVPMFTVSPVSRHARTSGGIELPVPVGRPAREVVAAKIAGLTTINREEQEWFISAAIACRAAEVKHCSTPSGSTARRGPARVDQQQLLAAARGLADDILGRAHVGAGRVNWLGVEPLDERYWGVSPLGAGLAHGYLGTAVFLAQLSALTGLSRYRNAARDAINPLPRLLEALGADDDLVAAVGGGAMLGLGGIAYGLLRLLELLGDDELRGWLGVATDLTTRAVSGEIADVSFASGAGGALAVLDACAGSTAARSTLAAGLAATRTGARGFARGDDGTTWALRRHNGAEAPVADEPVAAPRTTGWCRGAAGTVLARLDHPDHPPASADADVRLLLDGPSLADMSPCHGELGVLEALAGLAQAGHPEAGAVGARRTTELVELIHQSGPQCGTPNAVPTPGLLNGLAGIGYGLLRLGFPDSVPSILLLETTSS